MLLRISGLILLALLFFPCGGGTGTGTGEGEGEGEGTGEESASAEATADKEAKKIARPEFKQDTAFQFVAGQVAFGPRVPNTEAHQACGDYLIQVLRKYCDTVYVQEFTARAWDGTMLNLRNIIGSFNPEAKFRRFIAAHWDSRPYADHDPDSALHNQPIDGANDGGSGVGVILELARLMKAQSPPGGVDLILFDGEDYGEPQDVQSENYEHWALGSAHWSKNPLPKAYRANFGILLDMVGVENPEYTMEGTSMYFAPDIMRAVWDKAASLGYGQYFIKKETAPVVDDHLMVNQYAGIPCIDIIHREDEGNGFFEHWHTQKDNLENVDPKSLGMVGDVVLAVIYDGI